ncbi:MAG: NAD(P)-binding domain-containing protein [[Clostridium] innocuum]
METGLIGLGRMGLHIAMNMQSSGLRVYGYDIQQVPSGKKGIRCANAAGADCCSAETAYNLADASGRDITESMVHQLAELLKEGDYVIDGGNSFYRDSIRNYEFLKKKNIHFYDAGTSGGIRGALEGANFMIGGEREHFSVIEELFKSIAADHGYLYAGEVGSGHYLKMVHNGIRIWDDAGHRGGL